MLISTGSDDGEATNGLGRGQGGGTLRTDATQAEAISNHYIVVFEAGYQGNSHQLANDIVGKEGGTLKFTYGQALKGFSAVLTDAQRDKVARHPNVVRIEPDAPWSASIK
jgi:hypothetical protein